MSDGCNVCRSVWRALRMQQTAVHFLQHHLAESSSGSPCEASARGCAASMASMSLFQRLGLLLRCHAAGNSAGVGLAIPAAARRLSGAAVDAEQDRIVLRGLTFHGYHGALPEENVLGQKFVVDAVLWADLSAAGRSDKLADTIDYAAAYQEIRRVVEGPARQLQEAVAEELCQRLLQLDARVSAVRVHLRKPHVALQGPVDSVGVELLRRRRRA